MDPMVRPSNLLPVLLLCGMGLHAQTTPIAEARQITRSFNFDMTPSPDDRHLLMVTIVAGHAQIFVGAADGSRWEQVTTGAYDHEDPAWSPDAAHIAYVRTDGTTRVVHVMDRSGGNDRAVTPPQVRAIHPSWTPDGTAILFSTDDDLRPPAKNESEIYKLQLSTGGLDTLVTGGVNTFPVLSPDGRQLAYRKIIGEMNSEVFLADPDGSRPRNITDHPAYEGWPSWSPDGKLLAFAGNRNGKDYQIFLLRLADGHMDLLADTHGRATSPKWAPDGRSIYFTNCLPPENGGGCEIMFVMLNP